MMITSEYFWLYQNEEYIEANERMQRAAAAYDALLAELAWTPGSPEDRERVVLQKTECEAAREAFRSLRERLIANHAIVPDKLL